MINSPVKAIIQNALRFAPSTTPSTVVSPDAVGPRPSNFGRNGSESADTARRE